MTMRFFQQKAKHESPTALDLANPDVEQNSRIADLDHENTYAVTKDENQHIVDPQTEARLRRRFDRNLMPLVFVLC